MEGDVISMHDLFDFKQTGVDEDRVAQGYFFANGIRPRCLERLESGGASPAGLDVRAAHHHPLSRRGRRVRVTANSLSVLTFLAVVTAIAGAYSLLSDLFLRDRSRVNRRVDAEFLKRQRDQVRRQSLFKDAGPLGAAAEVHEASARRPPRAVRGDGRAVGHGPDARDNCRRRAAVAGLVAAALVGVIGANPLAGLVAVPHRRRGADPPRQGRSATRGWRNSRSQLPDAFDLMARVVRAGQTIAQALQAVSDEFPPADLVRIRLLLRAAEPGPLPRGRPSATWPGGRACSRSRSSSSRCWSSSRRAATSPSCSTSSRRSSASGTGSAGRSGP